MDLTAVAGAFLFLILILLLTLFLSSQSDPHTGLTTYPILGNLPDFIRNRDRYLDWTTEILSRCPTNTAVFRQPGNLNDVITADPRNVEHMLRSNFENFPKGERLHLMLEDFLGSGIFNADGEVWRIQRKTASYEFSAKSLRSFMMEIATVEAHTRLVPILESAARSGNVLDLQNVLECFAFDNICKVAFNVDPCVLGGVEDKSSGGGFMEAFENAALLSSDRLMYIFPGMYAIKKFLDIGSEKSLRKSIATVHEFADRIIRNRLEDKKGGNENNGDDFLSRFIAKEENSAEYLRDIVISFILAGRDTTSSALIWFFWLVSLHPNVEERILQELKTIRKQGNKSLGSAYTFDELRAMNYLQAAISESMRLYPPVPIDTRICKGDDVLPDGTFIGKGWFMTYHAFAMGRTESIWGKDCGEYRPERWLEDNGGFRQENPFKYPVFHAGPRMCLGKDMAYIQMKSVAALVLERFEFEVMMEKGKAPEYFLSLTLRMEGGLPVRVKERLLARDVV